MRNSADDATSRTPALPRSPKDPKATLESPDQPLGSDTSVTDGLNDPAAHAASAMPRV
jgi:hypothetical protein